MTLILSTCTSSGIVLSADSRQTYKNNAGMIRVGSDSAMKLFKLSNRMGVAISGRAFLADQGGAVKNTGWHIEQFRLNLFNPKLTIKQTADELSKYLAQYYVDNEMANLRIQISTEVQKLGGTDLDIQPPNGNLLPYAYLKDGGTINLIGSIETITFLIAGIDQDKIGRSYTVTVPNNANGELDTLKCGVTWAGQTEVIVRIIKGWAIEIGNLNFINQAITNGIPVQDELNKLEYIINWGTMTLQDAIDFSVLITKTTESIQRFSDGTVMNPGGITGVGGNIDIAIITPEKGFIWLKKKNLHSENTVLDIDKEPDLIENEEEN